MYPGDSTAIDLRFWQKMNQNSLRRPNLSPHQFTGVVISIFTKQKLNIHII